MYHNYGPRNPTTRYPIADNVLPANIGYISPGELLLFMSDPHPTFDYDHTRDIMERVAKSFGSYDQPSVPRLSIRKAALLYVTERGSRTVQLMSSKRAATFDDKSPNVLFSPSLNTSTSGSLGWSNLTTALEEKLEQDKERLLSNTTPRFPNMALTAVVINWRVTHPGEEWARGLSKLAQLADRYNIPIVVFLTTVSPDSIRTTRQWTSASYLQTYASCEQAAALAVECGPSGNSAMGMRVVKSRSEGARIYDLSFNAYGLHSGAPIPENYMNPVWGDDSVNAPWDWRWHVNPDLQRIWPSFTKRQRATLASNFASYTQGGEDEQSDR